MTTYRAEPIWLLKHFHGMVPARDVRCTALAETHALETHHTDLSLSTARGRETAHFGDLLVRLAGCRRG